MTTTQQPSKAINISLWVVQCLLGAMFLMAGFMKTATPIEELGKKLPWVLEVPALVRFIGISELLGALGLLLPSILRIQPKLTPMAAVGLVIIMILAIGYHGMHAEYGSVVFNVVLGSLAGFVAWGRFKKVPIQPKQ